MKRPLLSVIIPVYNTGTSVTRITSSILGQDFKDFELILVDDGSTDNTINILRGVKKNQKHIIVLSKKNGGPSSARNLGLKKAQGKFVLFLDADDDIHSSMFETMVRELEKSESEVVVSGWSIDLNTDDGIVRSYKKISPRRDTIQGEQLLIKKYVTSSIGNSGLLYNLWNKMFRLDIIKDRGIQFREDVRFGEDLIFFFDYLGCVKKISIIPDILYSYQASSKTSLFSTSALDPSYRHINADELKKFTQNHYDEKLNRLTNWVLWRWLISYYSLVSGADISRSKKLSLLKRAPNNVSPANSIRDIGIKKYLIEHMASMAAKSGRTALLFGSAVNLLKKTVIKTKSVMRKTQ